MKVKLKNKTKTFLEFSLGNGDRLVLNSGQVSDWIEATSLTHEMETLIFRGSLQQVEKKIETPKVMENETESLKKMPVFKTTKRGKKGDDNG